MKQKNQFTSVKECMMHAVSFGSKQLMYAQNTTESFPGEEGSPQLNTPTLTTLWTTLQQKIHNQTETHKQALDTISPGISSLSLLH